MNKAALAVILVAVVVGGTAFAYGYSSVGTLKVYITTGNADPIYIKVNSIMVHSNGGRWITISNKTETVLLDENLSFLASSNIATGNYTEMKLSVTSAMVSISGLNISVTMPSNVLKMPIVPNGIIVSGGHTSKLAILFGPHLLETGNGRFIISPVIVAQPINSSA